MQESQNNNQKVCILCCQEKDIFVLPKCNHKHICWGCCINMTKLGKFQCPFCRNSVQQKQMIIFVTLQQMLKYSFSSILKEPTIQLLKSQKNSNYYYSNVQVAQKIQYQTSYNCPFQQCQQIFQSLNQLKKHLDIKHKKQYCDICLNNRKCVQSQQILYSEVQYQKHIKHGQFTQNGDLVLFHPTCDFCKQTFYDIDEFRRHLEQVHQKCFICFKSSQELKYIYFKDYQQAVQHFKKSHFYCEIGNCLTTKFQNVFVSEQARQEHVQRVHKKAKKNDTPIMNIMLGFNKTQKDEVFEWDKIGKNFMSVFQMVQKHSSSSKLQPVQHENVYIDIRDFYAEQSKKTMYWTLNKIKQTMQDKMYDFNYKQKQLYIGDIDHFRPLDMQPVTKIDLQKFLNSIFDAKISSQIINKFFAGRQDFATVDQYFAFVKQKMRSYSKIAYYYAFPQLVRFFKNQNPHKALMDQFYYQSLRQLKVKRPFIIHTKSKYSEILFYLKQLIQKQIQERDEDSFKQKQKQLNVDKYLKFLSDMNSTYYIQNQQQIFYVSKQKITNLYHMINKCKVKDFLKMNWLLKIGFNNQAYKIIYKDFYYKEESECSNAMKKLSIQELAYLYSYCTICLEAIYQKKSFLHNKQKPTPLFMSQILNRIKKTSTHQRLKQIIELENKSLKIDNHARQNKNKGIILNKYDHPSLLETYVSTPSKLKPPDKQDDFPSVVSFGTRRPQIWNQNQNNSTFNNSKKIGKDLEQYPTILSNPQKQSKYTQKKTQLQEFPIFHYVGKKNKKQNKLNKTMTESRTMNDVIGWGNSGAVSSKWNEQQSLKNWQIRQQKQKKRKQRHEEVQQELKNPNSELVKRQIIQQKNNIIDNLINKRQQKQKKGKIQEKSQSSHQLSNNNNIQGNLGDPMVSVTKGKKQNKIDDEISFNQTKKKNKKNKNKKQNEDQKDKINKIEEKNNQKLAKGNTAKKESSSFGLFEQIQRQSQMIKKIQVNQNKKQQKQQDDQKSKKKLTKQVKTQVPKNFQQDQFVGQFHSKQEFPELPGKKSEKQKSMISINPNQKKNKSNTVAKQQQKIQNKIQSQAEQQKGKQIKKKKKMRFDDTSSEDQKKQTKVQHKKSEDFVSIADRYQKKAQQKMSKVNQIIMTAKVQQVPENIIKVKKGRNGKKTIVESVNFFNL